MDDERSYLTLTYPEDPRLDLYIQDDLEFSGASTSVGRIGDREYLLIPFTEAYKVILPDTRLVVAKIEHGYVEYYNGKLLGPININDIYNNKKFIVESENGSSLRVEVSDSGVSFGLVREKSQVLWNPLHLIRQLPVDGGGITLNITDREGELKVLDLLTTLQRRGYLDIFPEQKAKDVKEFLKSKGL